MAKTLKTHGKTQEATFECWISESGVLRGAYGIVIGTSPEEGNQDGRECETCII